MANKTAQVISNPVRTEKNDRNCCSNTYFLSGIT